MQLKGPVPSQLYHRYVEFRPFVAGMFTSHSLRGRILNRALHHQHARIYNFDRSTEHGIFTSPCTEMTQKFLEFVHYGQGGRIHTYVLTLDGQLRFTETGKEFGIDMLSKHTMHSDVSIYIAFSGEFFVRHVKHHHQHYRSSSGSSQAISRYSTEDRPSTASGPSKDPADYELFIDNDSGTYRPNAELLPLLKEFLSNNFPGLHITTLDCQKDADRMSHLKEEQREIKKMNGQPIAYMQPSSSDSESSLSSSDEEELEELAGGAPKQRNAISQKFHDMKDIKKNVMDWALEENHPDGPSSQPTHNGAAISDTAQHTEQHQERS